MSAGGGITEYQRWFFDAHGFLVVPTVIDAVVGRRSFR